MSNATQQALEELHNSTEMVNRRQAGVGAGTDAELVGREKRLADEWRAKALRGLESDLAVGRLVFLGRDDPAPSGDLRGMGQKIVQERIPEIYTQLDAFSASIKAADPLLVLRAATLDGLPTSLTDIGLIVSKPTGKEIETAKGPLKLVLDHIEAEHGYGKDVTGALLAAAFAAPPYGAPLEVVQAAVAAGVRTSRISVRYQGALIKNAGDQRLDAVFKGPAAFRSASFEPYEDATPVEKRVDLAKRLTKILGSRVNPATDELARTVREEFAEAGVRAERVRATMNGAGLVIPPAVATVAKAVADLQHGDDDGTVLTALAVWEDLLAGRSSVSKLELLLTWHLDDLRRARGVVSRGASDLPSDLVEQYDELKDILATGLSPQKAGRIAAIADAICAHRDKRVLELREYVKQRVEAERRSLQVRFPGVDPDAMAETVRDLEKLVPGEGDDVPAEVLEARLGAVQETARHVAHALDVVVAQERLATLAVGEIAPELIRTAEDLEGVLKRLDTRVRELLSDDKEVRLS